MNLSQFNQALQEGAKIPRQAIRGAVGSAGNVYYVVKSSESYYGQFVSDYQCTYRDGSQAVHPDDGAGSGIISALAATVECRDDYVLVQPADADYDITAALIMNKKCVHLLCLGGLGNDRGSTNAVRIEQKTAATAVIAVSDASIEIAGFYLKPYIGVSHITLAATSYAPNIHHNTIVLKWTSSNEAAIVGTGDAGAWGTIERNWFVSQAGDDQTCASIVNIKASATAARVNYNDFMIGDGNTATVGILNAATKGSCNYNTFAKAGADGDYGHCIQIGSYGTAIGNRGAVEDSILITGGAEDESLSDNMNGVDGGLIDES